VQLPLGTDVLKGFIRPLHLAVSSALFADAIVQIREPYYATQSIRLEHKGDERKKDECHMCSLSHIRRVPDQGTSIVESPLRDTVQLPDPDVQRPVIGYPQSVYEHPIYSLVETSCDPERVMKETC
jgi:hypothetical protein